MLSNTKACVSEVGERTSLIVAGWLSFRENLVVLGSGFESRVKEN